MIFDTVSNIVENYYELNDYEGLSIELISTFSLDIPFTEDDFKSLKQAALIDKVDKAVLDTFKRKMEKLAANSYPVIKQVYEDKGQQYENILVPIADGKRTFNVTVNLADAYKTESKEVVKSFEKLVLLYIIDEAWKEHLRELDELRNSVQNATYEQKDPLLIYKLESFNLFRTMIDTINRKVMSILMRGQVPMREPEQVRQASQEKRQDFSKYRTQKAELAASGGDSNPAQQDTREQQKTQPIRIEKKVGRNDPCPCGSGKKYKNCHGQNE